MSSNNSIDSKTDCTLNATNVSNNHLAPSPLPSRRTRSTSMSKLAAESPIQHGIIVDFNRGKGHGFVKPDEGGDTIFFHISDIDDEHVVENGDRVEFRTIPMPPKRDKKMAVELRLIDYDKIKPHERWDSKPDIDV